MKRIKFNHSSISWITREEESHGRFSVESVLRIKQEEKSNVFALAPAVLAGKMYVSGDLCKHPPYLFQLVAGITEYQILRTYVNPFRQAVTRLTSKESRISTSERDKNLFRKIEVQLIKESSRVLTSYEEVEASYHGNDEFSALVHLPCVCKQNIELEFPLKHINLLPSKKKWQVETGPILLFSFDQCLHEKSTLMHAKPGFIHFNHLEAADISFGFPLSAQNPFLRNNKSSGLINCKIQILVKDLDEPINNHK